MITREEFEQLKKLYQDNYSVSEISKKPDNFNYVKSRKEN